MSFKLLLLLSLFCCYLSFGFLFLVIVYSLEKKQEAEKIRLEIYLPMLVNRRDYPSPHKLPLSYQLDRKDICQCLNQCRARTPIWVNVLSLPLTLLGHAVRTITMTEKKKKNPAKKKQRKKKTIITLVVKNTENYVLRIT